MNGLTIAKGVYTLTYNTNGGSAIAAGIVLQGLSIATPPAPTRSGYTFVGWSASNGGGTLTFPYLPSRASNMTLYAKWTVATPTRTTTKTATRTKTWTKTATRTKIATRSKTGTPTKTATRTATRSITRTATPTLTATSTLTATATAALTATPTLTATATAALTATPTP
jgi:uncharacterized repeat protein (TIGR02543 family)